MEGNGREVEGSKKDSGNVKAYGKPFRKQTEWVQTTKRQMLCKKNRQGYRPGVLKPPYKSVRYKNYPTVGLLHPAKQRRATWDTGGGRVTCARSRGPPPPPPPLPLRRATAQTPKNQKSISWVSSPVGAT